MVYLIDLNIDWVTKTNKGVLKWFGLMEQMNESKVAKEVHRHQWACVAFITRVTTFPTGSYGLGKKVGNKHEQTRTAQRSSRCRQKIILPKIYRDIAAKHNIILGQVKPRTTQTQTSPTYQQHPIQCPTAVHCQLLEHSERGNPGTRIKGVNREYSSKAKVRSEKNRRKYWWM